MSGPWSLSRFGRPINLVEPTVAQVDFEEIAYTLAGVYRWAGAADPDVSVALHTLICLEAAEPGLAPWVLLHDAHEARIGDWTTPVQQAFNATARTVQAGGDFITACSRQILTFDHDTVIHAAAGLRMPTDPQKQAIKRADIVALNTEKRDFIRNGATTSFGPAIDYIMPLPERVRWMTKQMAAEKLFAAFRQHLPVFNQAPAIATGDRT